MKLKVTAIVTTCMKAALIIYFVSLNIFTHLLAVEVHAQYLDTKVSIQFRNGQSLANAIEQLRSATTIRFSYDPLVASGVNVGDKSFRSEKLRTILNNLLEDTDLTFKEQAGAIILYRSAAARPAPESRTQQSGRISGRVFDDRGEPLVGASLKVARYGTATQSSVDGSYALTLPAGTYTLEISYLGFQTKRITEVVVKGGELTTLNLVLNPATSELEQVVVTGSFKRESVAGLYAQQKVTASITDGISAEQMARTPDNNIGQVLKRVSGVTTVDNKYVVVRGLSERYNQAMIDGVVLPSTNMNRRHFSFDVIPQELVSNVVVNKTATPDMSAEFSGGQVIVNTIDIPTQNFTTITIGSGMNSQTTGKDFYTLGGRKGADYLGLSSHRKEPEGLQPWYWRTGVSTPPLGPDGDYPAGFPTGLELMPGSGVPYTSLDAIEQSRKLNADALYLNGYQAAPFSNARLALGRVYDFKNNLRFGFSGGATYRNQQAIVAFNNVRGQAADTDHMQSEENNPGTSHRFNSTIGAALNMGLQGENFKIALKNMYSHIFQDQFNETYRISYGASSEDKFREMFQDPQATGVWQHKLEGQNLLGGTGVKMDYTLGLTRIAQQTLDQRRLKYRRSSVIGEKEYFQYPDIYDLSRLDSRYDYRLWTDVKETDYNWGLSFSKNFTLGSHIKNMAKLGYSGWHKHRTLGMTKMIPFMSVRDVNNPIEGAYWDILSAESVGAEKGRAYYWAEDMNGPTFDGIMVTHAPYLMLDQRIFEKLRLVYGVRAEHYNLSNRQEDYARKRFGSSYELFMTVGEQNWRFLPSANLTYSLTLQMNARLAYSKTAIRPDFRETAYFGFYDFELDANISGRQLVSTIVDNFDLRYEWYPSAGEIISISGFYKKMKDPIELIFVQDGQYRFQNQYAAKNYGVEMEIRKSLAFIADKQWLHNITLFGNGTLLKSRVEVQELPLPTENLETKRLPAQDRPLYGQAPWIINVGVAYQDDVFGFTVSYNRNGHRSNTIHLDPAQVEYENGRNLLDVQVSTKLLKRKAELNLDVSNLLDDYILFYQNINGYEPGVPNAQGIPMKLKSNHTSAYEPENGDRITYRARTGRNIFLSFTYKF